MALNISSSLSNNLASSAQNIGNTISRPGSAALSTDFSSVLTGNSAVQNIKDLISSGSSSAADIPSLTPLNGGMSSDRAELAEDWIESGAKDDGVSLSEYSKIYNSVGGDYARLQDALADFKEIQQINNVGNKIISQWKDSKENNEVSEAEKNPNDQYLDLYNATQDPSFLEKYLDNLIEQYNTQSAREYETEMSNTSFSRLIKDIENAGYNPWLALQSGFGQSSTPNVAPAGTSAISYSEQKNSRRNVDENNTADIWGKVISMFGTALLALAIAL